jgi:hypothetical protein
MTEGLDNIDTYRRAEAVMRIFRSAVRKAQAESRRLGVPDAYSFNGVRYFELPNGDYSRTEPKSLGSSSL